MSRKIILIDGNSLVYRAFYALPTTLTLQSGQVTNAVYGFTSMLIRLLINEQPDTVAVAFDTREPTWRHKEFAEYKAHRDATPDELISQMPLVKEVLKALNIPSLELPGHEADDILATLAVKAHAKGDNVLVVTADKDAFQLIKDDGISVMTTRKGITDIVIYDREKVQERYGIWPEQIPDFLGLKGDSSDNIPGVPGVGDKTAAKLLREFDTVEGIYQGLDGVKGEKLRQNLIDNQEQAEISKRLAILTTDLPLELDTNEIQFGNWDQQEVRDVFSRLEFRTLLDRLEAKLPGTDQSLTHLEIEIEQIADPVKYLDQHMDVTAVGLEVVISDEKDAVGIALAISGDAGERAAIIPLVADDGSIDKTAADALLRWLSRPELTICSYDLKSKIPQLDPRPGPMGAATNLLRHAAYFDPMLAAYLLAPVDIANDLKSLCRRYLETDLAPTDDSGMRAAVSAAAALALREPLVNALANEGLSDLYDKIELPLARVLALMEATGVGLDREKLKHLGVGVDDNLKKASAHIYELAGEEFNINSPQQVSNILFDKLGMTPVRKTKSKSAYATDASVLAKLATEHAIVPLILEYRELAKLKSTYINALPKMINSTSGRIHTSFNQAVTATGRLSSSNPNLQNIPMRTEIGRRIREAFVPAHRDEHLMAADYSQIELRLLAHVSQDEVLINAFLEGADIHSATAAEVFGVDRNEVTKELRQSAKAINFGIVYGMSAYGLAQQLNIAPEEAKQYIDLYFGRYARVKDYIDQAIKDAYQKGYVSTITGRKRQLPELKSANHNQRSFGERVAVNAPLQGSAADIIKIAMVDIDDWLAESGLQTRMVLQVHDELIFEVPPLEEAVVEAEVVQRMQSAYKLSVPLEVNVGFGRNWGETK